MSLEAKLMFLEKTSTCFDALGFWRLKLRYGIASVHNVSLQICDCDSHMGKHMLATVKDLGIPELRGAGRYKKPRDDSRAASDHPRH